MINPKKCISKMRISESTSYKTISNTFVGSSQLVGVAKETHVGGCEFPCFLFGGYVTADNNSLWMTIIG